MPKTGTTVDISGILATVDNDGIWDLPLPPKNKRDTDCTRVEVLARWLYDITGRVEISPGDGEPSVVYADRVVEEMHGARIKKIVRVKVPKGVKL